VSRRCALVRGNGVSEGDLNSSRTGNIRVHPRSFRALSGVDFTRSNHRRDIRGHLDTWAAVSNLVSKLPLTAARSPPASSMH
jgi:hypothetical protein